MNPFDNNSMSSKQGKKTEPTDFPSYDVAGTIGYPEQISIDGEDIDLDTVVPGQIPQSSAAKEAIESLDGIVVQTGQSSLFGNIAPMDAIEYVPQQTGAPWSHSSSGANSDSRYLSHISSVAPSVQTDSGYGSVLNDDPRPPQKYQPEKYQPKKYQPKKYQPKKAIREPLDIVVERTVIETSVVQGIENITEAQTLYIGDQIVMGTNRTRQYILEFANHIHSQFQEQITFDSIERIRDLLPELLTAFALKLGQTAQLQIKRDAMYFVHTHRSQITQSMEALFKETCSIRGSDTNFGAEVDETNALWREGFSADNPVAEADDECSPEDISRYLDAVTKDPAFRWLIGKLKNVLVSTDINSDAMKKISSNVLRYLPPVWEISRKHPSKPFKGIFDVECDILGFLKDQEYHEGAADVLPKVITLTGSIYDTQATTCEQYLLQTWPTVGCNLLQAIQGAIREYKASEHSCTYKFEDRTEIKVHIGERSTKVEVLGTAQSIAEIGEQIGWFATAFGSSFQDSVITFCHPEIISCQVEDAIDSQSEEFEKTFTCRLLTFIDEISENLPHIKRQCWQQMFNNPVVVVGYPIKPRENIDSGTGLEIPFEMMAALADARYLTNFGGKTVVKGFSTVLIPMRQQGNLFIWHLHTDTSGARISYRDPRIQQGILISSDNFMDSRHILGWCSNAQNNIGSPDACYNIGYSGLSRGKGSLSWEAVDLSVGVGNYFKVGTTFARGKKDRSTCSHILNGYVSLVEHIGKHHIILYDAKERRAWLSDGLPVLLHLVRTSLIRDEKEDPEQLFTSHVKKLNEAPPSTQGTMAAKVVLFDDDNRMISLRLKDPKVTEQIIERTINGQTTKELVKITEKTYIRLENRIEEICLLLEKTIDETAKAVNEGVLKGAPKNIIGGFDFVSVATRSNLRLITTKIPISEHGSGWTDLYCSLEAITLFGNDFGELIKPRAGNPTINCDNCGFQACLPSGKNLLAVCVDVLEKILEVNGSNDTTLRRLTDDLYWHINGAAFAPCRCISSNGRGSKRDWIQILSSKGIFHSVSPDKSIKIDKKGAAIFGHSRTKPFFASRNTGADERTSSSDNDTQSQIPLSLPTSSEVQDGSSETNKTQMFGTMWSNTPDTSASSRTDGLALASSHQVSEAESSAAPSTSSPSRTPILDLNNTTIDQQRSSSSDIAITTADIIVVPLQIASDSPPTPSPSKSIGKIKKNCAKAWRKINPHKNNRRLRSTGQDELQSKPSK